MTKSKIASLAEELSALVQADAQAIQDIADTAAEQMDAILSKYAEVPADISIPNLSAGRNAVSTLRMNFPKNQPGMPGMPGMPPMPGVIA